MSQRPEDLHVVFQNAFNRHDLDAIAALYEPDAVFVTGQGPVRGREAIRDAYREILASKPTIETHTLGTTRGGDLCLLHGKWTVRRTGPDGNEVSAEGRNTEIVRLQADGRWLFAIDNPRVP